MGITRADRVEYLYFPLVFSNANHIAYLNGIRRREAHVYPVH